MDRRAPIILLIEHDDIDRMTLTRMLRESGYRVMAASRGVDALDTFVIHHLHIALVLANARLPDVRGDRLLDALHWTDARVPVVIGAWHADHWPDSRAASSRAFAFGELIAEVRRRLQDAPAATLWPSGPSVDATPVQESVFFPASSTHLSSGDRHGAFTWPVRDEDLDEIEGVDPTLDGIGSY